MQEDLFNFSFDLQEMERLQNLKNFTNENEEKIFYTEISKKAMFLTDESIKLLFNLTNEEFETDRIQRAIKIGELYGGNLSGELIYKAALNGEKWAILKMQEMNKGKQKQEIKSREVVYKNANTVTDWDALEKSNIFGQLSEK